MKKDKRYSNNSAKHFELVNNVGNNLICERRFTEHLKTNSEKASRKCSEYEFTAQGFQHRKYSTNTSFEKSYPRH